ncbi:MAG TPA: hypothetical protein VJ967_01265 [Clostridia bacterium]|nr:hypothetical protein [Clostridia bacterium]
MKQTTINISPEAANYALDYDELMVPDFHITINAIDQNDKKFNYIKIHFHESGSSNLSDAILDAWAEAPSASPPSERSGYFLKIVETADLNPGDIKLLRIENNTELDSTSTQWNDGELLISFDGSSLNIELNGTTLFDEIVTKEHNEYQYSEEEKAYWEQEVEEVQNYSNQSTDDQNEKSRNKDSVTEIAVNENNESINKDDSADDIPF